MLCNALVILLVPLLARLLVPLVQSPLRSFGFSDWYDALSGRGGFTDIGVEVGSSHGLIDPGYSAYDTTVALDPLTGMGAYGDWGHTHPPPALPLGIPLALLDYRGWLPFWVVLSIGFVAWSMRVMCVPAWVAYPLAVGICLTPPGMLATVSTYPAMALILALAWMYREHPWLAGPAYAVMIASRGVAGVLLCYPLARRQWKTLAITVGILIALTLIALAFEPTVVFDFLTLGRDSIDANLSRTDLFTFDAVLGRRGLPRVIVWVVVAGIVIVGVRLRREPFWLAVWAMFAVTPIAWTHTPVAALPLFVAIWYAGPRGRFISLLVGVVFFAGLPVGWNVAWPIVVVLSAIAVLTCPVGQSQTDVQSELTP